jgi:hypothetical protein
MDAYSWAFSTMRRPSKWRQYHAHSAWSPAPPKQLPTISSAAAPASSYEHVHGSRRLAYARAGLEQLVSQETRACSFPFPFSLKGVKGDFLFSASLFFEGEAGPVDNFSVIFVFLFWVLFFSPRGTSPRGKSNVCRAGQPRGKKKAPRANRHEGQCA